MEDSFKVRVDKVFGSLTSSPSSLWSLTDEEIEKREWNRDTGIPENDDESNSFPSNLDGFFASQNQKQQQHQIDLLKELEEDEDEEDEEGDDAGDFRGPSSKETLVKPDDHNDEEWEIRSAIGADCTLDNEDEEDEFDKVAAGRENPQDRTYMTEINDYGAYSDTRDELPNSFKDVSRDPRANHMAAKLRLKEDAEAAGNFESSVVSDKTIAADARVNTSEDGVHLKSILKRREIQGDSKSRKRVRFDPESTNNYNESKSGEVATETCPMEESPDSNGASMLPQSDFRVPDYIRNPSRYTHYTFDSLNEVDEESNQNAYMDFFNMVRRSKTKESQPNEGPVDFPKSVTFTARKKKGDVATEDTSEIQEAVSKERPQGKGMPLIIAAGDVVESEVCDMEEDEPNVVPDSGNDSRRPNRQYRTKSTQELDECISE